MSKAMAQPVILSKDQALAQLEAWIKQRIESADEKRREHAASFYGEIASDAGEISHRIDISPERATLKPWVEKLAASIKATPVQYTFGDQQAPVTLSEMKIDDKEAETALKKWGRLFDRAKTLSLFELELSEALYVFLKSVANSL